MKSENGFKFGVKCKICGAQPSITTPIGYAYCEACITALYGLCKARRCTHCGKALKQDVIAKGDVFCSIDCAVNHWLGIKANSDNPDNQTKREIADYRFDLDY